MTRSDLELERIALGEHDIDDLTAEERRRVADLRASNAEILTHYPPAGVKREVERRLHTPKRSSASPWVLAPIALAVGMITLVAIEDAPTERTKGDAHLVVHQKTATGVKPLHDGDRLAAGDLLQVGYSPGGHGYGAVLSIDGRGTVTLHWPHDADAPPPPVQPGGDSLPASYELDDAPRFERFFLVTCDQRFDVNALIAAAKSLPNPDGTLDFEVGCRIDTLRLEKANP